MQRMLQSNDGAATAASPHVGVEQGHWLLLIYRVPADPSSARSAVWRAAKRLGALSLQHAIFLLPLSPATRAAYAQLARRIEEYGGETTILETASPDAAWHAKTVARFNAARDEEYDEVIDEARCYRTEIAREQDQDKYTFVELDDQESSLDRLRVYLERVRARDAFAAPGYARAAGEIERCAELCEAFAQDVYARQGNGR
jgi:hypothetical protein